MAKIALVHSRFPGHAGPIGRLGSSLARHGHNVVEFGPGWQPRDISPRPAEMGEDGSATPRTAVLDDVLELSVALAETTAATVGMAVEALNRSGAELLVHDVVVPEARVAARWLGLPTICSCPIFPGDFGPPEAANGAIVAPDRDAQFERLHRATDEIARTWGVDLGDWMQVIVNRGDRNVVFTTPEILGDVELDASFRCVGPMMDPLPGASEPLLAGWSTGPLIYMALGTTFTARRELYAAVLEGLAELPVRVLVSTWGRFTSDDLAPVPANARVAARVNSRAVLREARLHITHAGAGSLHESLVEGVPMLCLPQGFDNRRWAECAAALGAADILAAQTSAEAIRDAVERALADDEMHRRAAEAARSLAAYDGARVVADTVDELLPAG